MPRLVRLSITRLAALMPLHVNRAPVLALWAVVVAERLGHPPDTALTLGPAARPARLKEIGPRIGRAVLSLSMGVLSAGVASYPAHPDSGG